jgi:hypothetical protein
VGVSLNETRQRRDFKPEQFDFIVGKLDEIQIMYVIGTFTNIVVMAALDQNVDKHLFQVISNALSWVYGPIKLLL